MSVKSADLGKITSTIKNVIVNYIGANEDPSAEVRNIDSKEEGVPDIELILNLPSPKSAYDIAVEEGFVGDQTEFVQMLSLAEEERENVVPLYVGSYSYNEDFSTVRSDFNGTQPYGYDFGNGLKCEVLNTKNATLTNGSYGLIDNETNQTVWLNGFLSNGNSGDVFRLSLPKATKITLKVNSFRGLVNLSARREAETGFLLLNNESTSLSFDKDGKLYTVEINDDKDEQHDLIIGCYGSGLRFYNVSWESLETIDFQSAFNKFKQFYKNTLSLEGSVDKSIFADLVAVADEQPFEFTLDLQNTTGLNMWGIATAEDGIIDTTLQNCKNLLAIITPKGHIIYNNHK